MFIFKHITWFGRQCLLSCDGNCRKAWGINNRPRINLSADDPDDYAYLSDGELGDAPDFPGTYEGVEMAGKPITDGCRLNKWCARECERSVIIEDVECKDVSERLPDLSVRIFNIPRRS
jgi:hypothetical protein